MAAPSAVRARAGPDQVRNDLRRAFGSDPNEVVADIVGRNYLVAASQGISWRPTAAASGRGLLSTLARPIAGPCC